MNRNGFVVAENGKTATVNLLRHTACGDCGACHLGDESKEIKMEVINEKGAHVGDLVEIEMADGNVLQAAFIIYTIPLIALLVGVFFGSFVGQFLPVSPELWATVFGVAFMTVVFLFIKKNEAKFKVSGKFNSEITKVLQEGNMEIL